MKKITLDLRENNIDLSGEEYINNYMKENDSIEELLIDCIFIQFIVL